MTPCGRRTCLKQNIKFTQTDSPRSQDFCRIRDYLRKIIKKRETMLLGEERNDAIASNFYSSHIILHHNSSDMTLHDVPQK